MATARHTYFVTIQGDAVEVEIEPEEGHALVRIQGVSFNIAGDYQPGKGIQEFLINGEAMRFRLENQQQRLVLARHGQEVKTRAMTQREHDLYAVMPEKRAPDTLNQIISPMPGKVIAVHVSAGERVKPGARICVLEAMKMENVLYADIEAMVEEVLVRQGDTVDADQLLVRFTRAEEEQP